MPFFGQDLFLRRRERDRCMERNTWTLSTKAKLDARARDRRGDGPIQIGRASGADRAAGCLTDHIDGDHDLGGSSTPAAVAGLPPYHRPVGFVFGLPVGISFFSRAWSEPALLSSPMLSSRPPNAPTPRFLATAELSGSAEHEFGSFHGGIPRRAPRGSNLRDGNTRQGSVKVRASAKTPHPIGAKLSNFRSGPEGPTVGSRRFNLRLAEPHGPSTRRG